MSASQPKAEPPQYKSREGHKHPNLDFWPVIFLIERGFDRTGIVVCLQYL